MSKIKELRLLHKLSQQNLADILNVHQTAVSQWEKGRTFPDMETLKKLSAYFNVSADEILGNEDNKPKGIKIPMIGKSVVAESSAYYDEEINADVCIKFEGDSMINAYILDGDIVLIKQNVPIISGQIYAVRIDKEITLKRVFQQDNILTLMSENSDYPPIVVTVNGYNNVEIIGKVVGIRRTIK